MVAQVTRRSRTVALPTRLPWEALLVGFLLTILFIPSRRYTLSSSLPFQAEPYRVMAGVVIVAWLSSALIDPRVRIRRTPFDGPIAAFVMVAIASLTVNQGRAESVANYLVKQLGFFLGVVLLVYFIASVTAGRVDIVELVVKVLVGAGVVLAMSAIFEARTGTNVFGSLNKVVPILEQANVYDVNAATDSRGAQARAFASSQHPIEFGAVLVMLIPLAFALVGATRQRRWWVAVALFMPAMFGALSRTVVPMLAAAIIAGIWTRRKEVVRLWPALIPLVVIIHFAVPGALGSLTKSFFPEGGLIADQQTGAVGSGRISTLGPVLRHEFSPNPVLGVGFATRVTTNQDPETPANAPILDNQWLGVIVETGVLGVAAMMWFFLRFIRRSGRAARKDLTSRGWLLAGMTSSVAAFMLGMFTFDAFAFVQVTFLFAVIVGLAAALLIEPQDDAHLRATTRRVSNARMRPL